MPASARLSHFFGFSGPPSEPLDTVAEESPRPGEGHFEDLVIVGSSPSPEAPALPSLPSSAAQAPTAVPPYPPLRPAALTLPPGAIAAPPSRLQRAALHLGNPRPGRLWPLNRPAPLCAAICLGAMGALWHAGLQPLHALRRREEGHFQLDTAAWPGPCLGIAALWAAGRGARTLALRLKRREFGQQRAAEKQRDRDREDLELGESYYRNFAMVEPEDMAHAHACIQKACDIQWRADQAFLAGVVQSARRHRHVALLETLAVGHPDLHVHALLTLDAEAPGALARAMAKLQPGAHADTLYHALCLSPALCRYVVANDLLATVIGAGVTPGSMHAAALAKCLHVAVEQHRLAQQSNVAVGLWSQLEGYADAQGKSLLAKRVARLPGAAC